MAKKVTKKRFNYQAARAELDEILSSMQQENTDIEDMSAKYERGLQLIADLEDYLSEAENKITEIKARFNDPQTKGE